MKRIADMLLFNSLIGNAMCSAPASAGDEEEHASWLDTAKTMHLLTLPNMPCDDLPERIVLEGSVLQNKGAGRSHDGVGHGSQQYQELN